MRAILSTKFENQNIQCSDSLFDNCFFESCSFILDRVHFRCCTFLNCTPIDSKSTSVSMEGCLLPKPVTLKKSHFPEEIFNPSRR
jgi:hypothetical protein